MRERLTLLILPVGLAFLLAACGGYGGGGSTPTAPSGGQTGGQDTTTVVIPSSGGYGTSTFSPGNVTIQVGKSVTWSNQDSFTHNSTGPNGAWNSNIAPGGSFTRVFPAAGSFDYRCTIHPGMSGTITVQ